MIISVASGKGGTGKTTVAVNLALAAGLTGTKVQLLDCDVEEPNCHIFLKVDFTFKEQVTIPVPFVDDKKCTLCGTCGKVCEFHAIMVGKKHVLLFPELCHGCGACSYLCPQKAITETQRRVGIVEKGNSDGIFFVRGYLDPGEALSVPVISKVKSHISKDGLIILDTPPGTACNMVESVKGTDICILVTEPTPFGLHDLSLAADTVKKLGVPACVVINRSDLEYSAVTDFCKERDIPVIAKIPLDREIARLYAQGKPLVSADPKYEKIFRSMLEKAGNVARRGVKS